MNIIEKDDFRDKPRLSLHETIFFQNINNEDGMSFELEELETWDNHEVTIKSYEINSDFDMHNFDIHKEG